MPKMKKGKKMIMKICSMHIPENIPDIPVIKTVDSGDIGLNLASFEFRVENLNWAKVEDELNTIVVDQFLDLLSSLDSELVETEPLVGLVWIYNPTSGEKPGMGNIKYAQIVMSENNIETYFGKELAVETQLEFFEAI